MRSSFAPTLDGRVAVPAIPFGLGKAKLVVQVAAGVLVQLAALVLVFGL